MARPASRIQSARRAAKRSTRGPRPAMASGRVPGLHGSAPPRTANSPWWSTASPRRSPSTTSTHSARAANGRCGARPIGVSTRLPPAPKPATMRSGASSANDANAAAVARGWRLCGLVTAPNSSTRRVRCARTARVTNRSRSVPSSATSTAAAPSASATAANWASSDAGRTACSQTPHCVSWEDIGPNLLGQHAQRTRGVRADHVPGQDAAQAGLKVFA